MSVVFLVLCRRIVRFALQKHGQDCSVRQSSLDSQSSSPPNNDTGSINCILTQLGYQSMASTSPCEEVNTIFLHPQGDNRPFVRIELLGIKLVALLDSGTNRNILGKGSERLMANLNLNYTPSDMTLITAEGHPVQVLGEISVPVLFNGITRIVSFVVAPSLKRHCYLGMSFWDQFGIYPLSEIRSSKRSTTPKSYPKMRFLCHPKSSTSWKKLKLSF